jgi:alcohol dehydrogenase
MGDWGGMVSDLVRVPFADAMLVHVPAGVDPMKLASASDNMPDAWRAVGPQLAKEPNASVLVVGGGARSIGLYAAGMAVALGASRVDYVDDDPERLAIAQSRSARVPSNRSGEPAGSTVTLRACTVSFGSPSKQAQLPRVCATRFDHSELVAPARQSAITSRRTLAFRSCRCT